MNTIGLIPARGGSKGIRRKNVRNLAGRPLLQYTIEAALGSSYLSRVVLSTDDPEIAEIGARLGAEVPFMRPSDLGEDGTPTFAVVRHCVEWMNGEGVAVDAVCLLEPTNPLRTSDLIDECICRLTETGADCVTTVLPVPTEFNPHWVYFRNERGELSLSTGESVPISSRQMLPAAFHRDGAVYVSRVRTLREHGNLYGRVVVGVENDPRRSVNIDSWADWEEAESKLTAIDQKASDAGREPGAAAG